MTRIYRSCFQDLINVSTMPATMLKNKVMYRQFIQCRFCKLKMLYMFKAFVSLLSGHASYYTTCGHCLWLTATCMTKKKCLKKVCKSANHKIQPADFLYYCEESQSQMGERKLYNYEDKKVILKLIQILAQQLQQSRVSFHFSFQCGSPLPFRMCEKI